MKCCRYNHIAKNCKYEKIVCRKCSESHTISECKSADFKCINCDTANKKYGLQLDTKHRVDDNKCDVKKKKLEIVRRRVK